MKMKIIISLIGATSSESSSSVSSVSNVMTSPSTVTESSGGIECTVAHTVIC